jgi:POT family proton-dependent oligopeptide transporter
LAWTAAVALVVTTLVASGVLAFSAQGLANLFGLVLLAITVIFFGWLFTSSAWTVDERRRLILILVLFLGATAFWSLFEQGGSTLTLFADRNTDRTVLGFEFPASWLLSLNPIFIIGGLAPAFAWLWVRMGPREPSSPAKFTLGLAFMALGYLLMIAAAFEAERGVLVSPLWLATMFLLHTMGEMCLSPVGLSAMTRLAPARIAGLTMGVWFLAASIGSYIGGRVGGLYDTLTLPQIFGALTVFALIATVLMGCAVKPLRRSLEHSRGT